eukprot:m.56369 g.56369  ORF g.56369 m.56369 type:complete len:76 (+) comp22236_c0_seq1:296-523(+)
MQRKGKATSFAVVCNSNYKHTTTHATTNIDTDHHKPRSSPHVSSSLHSHITYTTTSPTSHCDANSQHRIEFPCMS